MKLIHCADLHLDSKMETNLSLDQAKERRYEILSTFEKMVDWGLKEQVRVILISGDLFDTPATRQKTIKNRVLERIKSADTIDFLYLSGNHDKDNFFRNLKEKPENLKLFSNTWTSYTYGDVVITGKELDQSFGVMDQETLQLKEEMFNVVMLHGQVSQYAAEKQNELIPLSLLTNKHIDYLALGHIHEYKIAQIDQRGSWCYSGALEGRGFDECGKKGFVYLEIKNHQWSSELISLSKRQFHEIVVDITELDTSIAILEVVKLKLADVASEDMVKLVLTGRVKEENEVDFFYLTSYLKQNYYFCKVKDETSLTIDYTKYQHDISLKGEFVRLVQEMSIDESEKNQILMTGIHAILGKEDLW